MVKDGEGHMEPVQIGVRQLYDLMIALDGKIDSYIHTQEPRIALLTHRITELESRQAKSGDRQWMLVFTLITSAISLLCALIALLGK